MNRSRTGGLPRREHFRLRTGLAAVIFASAILVTFPLLLGPDIFKEIDHVETAHLAADRLTAIAAEAAFHTGELAEAIAPIDDPPAQFAILDARLRTFFPGIAEWRGGVQVVGSDGNPISWAGDLTGRFSPGRRMREMAARPPGSVPAEPGSAVPLLALEKRGDILWLVGRAPAGGDRRLELFIPIERSIPFSWERENRLIAHDGFTGVEVILSEGPLAPGPEGTFAVTVPGEHAARDPGTPETGDGSVRTGESSDAEPASSSVLDSGSVRNGGTVPLFQADGRPAGEVRCRNAGLTRTAERHAAGSAACWIAVIFFTAALFFATPAGKPISGLALVTAGQAILRAILLVVPDLTEVLFGAALSGPEYYASVAGFGLLESPADLFLTSLQLSIIGLWWFRFAGNGDNGNITRGTGLRFFLPYSLFFAISAAAAWLLAPYLLFNLLSSAPGVFPPFRGVFFSAPELLLSTAAVLITAVTVLFAGTISRLAASAGWAKLRLSAAAAISAASGWLLASSNLENGTAATLYFILPAVYGAFLGGSSFPERRAVPFSKLLFFPAVSAVAILLAQYGLQGGDGGWRSAAEAANKGEQVWIRMLLEESLEDFARLGAGEIIGDGTPREKDPSGSKYHETNGAEDSAAYRIWLRTGLAAEGIPSSIELYSGKGEQLDRFSTGFPPWFRLDALDLLDKVGATGELVILRGWERNPGSADEEAPFYAGRLRLGPGEDEMLQVIVTALGRQSSGRTPIQPSTAGGFDFSPPSDGDQPGGRWRITFLLGLLGLAAGLMLLAVPALLRQAGTPGRWRSVAVSFRFRLLVAMVALSLLPILFWGAFAVHYRTGNLREQHEERIRRGLEQLAGVLESGRPEIDAPSPGGASNGEGPGGARFETTGYTADGSGLALVLEDRSLRPDRAVLNLDEQFCRDMASVLSGDVRIYAGMNISADNRPENLLTGLRQRRMDGAVYNRISYGGEASVIAEESLGGISHLTGYRALEDREGKYVGAIAVTLRAFEEKAAVERSLFTADVTGLAAIWVLLTMAGSLFLSARISVSIARVTSVTEQLAGGKFGRIGPISTMDEVKRLVSSFNIMSDRLKTNRDLLERNRNFLSSTLDSLDAAVLAADSSGGVVFANRKMRLELSRPGKTAEEREGESLSPPGDAERGAGALELLTGAGFREQADMLETLLKGGDVSLQRETAPPGGGDGGTWRVTAHRLESSKGGLLGVVLVIEDLSDVIRSKKLVAWGEMARQVAHEIKNPLTPMKLQAQHIRHAWRDGAGDFDEILQESLEVIIEQIERLRCIATEFSWFAGRPDRAPSELQVAVVAEACLSDYGDLESRGIDVRADLPTVFPSIRMSEEELRRVIINLFENALQAMGESGELSISLRREPEGGQILVVADTGGGIPAGVVERLFEPYFSTKFQGTGLGLPIVQSILERYGAEISLAGAEGEGTSAEVRFPASMEIEVPGTVPDDALIEDLKDASSI